MECFIISGMSGAGKTVTTNILEDMGYYCIDNMPTRLIVQFVDLFKANTTKYEKVAFVVDIRGDGDFLKLYDILQELEQMGDITTKTLFLDASNDVLIQRHKEKRRKHPLESSEHSLAQAVAIERELLDVVRQHADYVVDTSAISAAQLQTHIINLFEGSDSEAAMVITVGSFGFKYGIPSDSDMVFDVRCLKNPYYEKHLKARTGLEKDVADYIFSDPNTTIFVNKIMDMMDFLIPLYRKEGKTSIMLSIGCTGGRHRSVAVTERIASLLRQKKYNVNTNHRDIVKG